MDEYVKSVTLNVNLALKMERDVKVVLLDFSFINKDVGIIVLLDTSCLIKTQLTLYVKLVQKDVINALIMTHALFVTLAISPIMISV